MIPPVESTPRSSRKQESGQGSAALNDGRRGRESLSLNY